MADPVYVFIDFDDTLSDFTAHGAQYVRELSCLLAADFGGDELVWAAAIEPELLASIHRYVAKFAGNPLAGYNDWLRQERVKVAEHIFEAVGRPLPRGENVEELAARVQFDALTSCKSTFPGAEEALRGLFEAGVRVQTASSQESEYLLAALIGAGLESYTESKFGPDLIDCAKEGPEFYQRVFEACKIRPSQAIVVDDQAMCLDYAEEVGAKVIQVCVKPDPAPVEYPIVLNNLVDLPGLVQRLAG